MSENIINPCEPRPDCPMGHEMLQDPMLNKGISFSEAERKQFRLEGLLPPGFNSLEEQVIRTVENFKKKTSDFEKYHYMMDLMERDLTLFNRVVLDNLEEMMPILYTPTVGRASQEFSHIFQKPQGIFLSEKFQGRFEEILGNWPVRDVRVVIVTDGERILGLGDLGVSGMAIPIGKYVLYMACAGIHPSWGLPMTIDAGTNNASLLNDPLYLGLRRPRIRGDHYDELMEEFITAISRRYPDALIHFEDFGNVNAFRLLKKYRDRACVFNDDIQGTAAVALAGLYSATRIQKSALRDQTFLFLGAGGAGIGIAELIVAALMEDGLSETEARRRCWFVDSKGLVVRSREYVTPVKTPFAHDAEWVPDLEAAVEAIAPTAIIGVSGQPKTFTPRVLELMAKNNRRPIVFALSNPTSKSECTAEEAYTWTRGRAIFAGGSPFDPVTIGGETFVPGQGNNAYIFPGLGLGVIASRARNVPDEMFLTAARTLSETMTADDLENGRIYPPLQNIRDVSMRIAAAVAGLAFEKGWARIPAPEDIHAHVLSHVHTPVYGRYA